MHDFQKSLLGGGGDILEYGAHIICINEPHMQLNFLQFYQKQTINLA